MFLIYFKRIILKKKAKGRNKNHQSYHVCKEIILNDRMPKDDIKSLLSNSTVSALNCNVGPSDNMIGLSFNMAATRHTHIGTEVSTNI